MTEEILPPPATTTDPKAPRANRIGRPQTARLRATPVRQEAQRQEPLQREGRLKRNRKRTDDKFYVSKEIIPTGVSYEWKSAKCWGADMRDHMTNLLDNNWKPVPHDRHPGLVVEKEGMILMERPDYLTIEAHMEDYNIAMDQVQGVGNSIVETPQGHLTRQHPSAEKVNRVNIKRDRALQTTQEGNLMVSE